MIEANKTPGRSTLEAVHEKTSRFLMACGRSVPIRRALAQVGYDQAAAHEGWRLFLAAAGYDLATGTPVEAIDARVDEALRALDAWDEPYFARADAVLSFDFSAQHERLFAGGLRPQKGAASVISVQTFLDRIDALEGAGEAAAVAALAKVGLDAAERARVRALLVTAKSVTPVENDGGEEVDFEARLVDLWRWYRKWSALARTAITRRDHLIQLGLTNRRKPDGTADDPADDE
jgi:hypothetical protein